MEKENRSTRSCKKCKHYDAAARFCKSFVISVSSTRNATYCKTYSPFAKSIPKNRKYNHKRKPKAKDPYACIERDFDSACKNFKG